MHGIVSKFLSKQDTTERFIYFLTLYSELTSKLIFINESSLYIYLKFRKSKQTKILKVTHSKIQACQSIIG